MLAKKIRIKPSKEQTKKLFESSGVSRWAYNWTLAQQEENYKKGNKFIQDSVLRKEITKMKKTKEYFWLNEVSNDIPKQAIKDACKAYKDFFKGKFKKPKFKSKKLTKPSFYNDTSKLKLREKEVFILKVGWMKTSEKMPLNVKVYNPRVTFDGKYWYISLSYQPNKIPEKLSDDSIGIDLGIKELAIVSDGTIYKNINKSKVVKSKKKRLRRLQRNVSKKYEFNKKGGNYTKTSNIIKMERKIRLLQRSLSNVRINHLHQTTTSIVKTKPKRIVVEDLNIKGMMKNKKLAKHISEQKFYEFKRQLGYKCELVGIELVYADRFFPSSKTCSNCGNVKKDLKLSDRVYSCGCGFTIDRDMNAALNLANYGLID